MKMAGMVIAVTCEKVEGSVDILKKHHSKSTSSFINRLPDPRIMAEVRDGFDRELVRYCFTLLY